MYSDNLFEGIRLFNVAPAANPEDPFRSKSKSSLKSATHEAIYKTVQSAINLTDVKVKPPSK